MRVLVCGGRAYFDREHVFRSLDEVHASEYLGGPITLLMHGGARGTDRLADEWARDRGVLVQVFPANWRLHGRSAGPIRNRQMLKDGQPQLILAFPGGPGTRDMTTQGRQARIKVLTF